MLILSRSFTFVKDFAVPQILLVTLLVYRHECDDRILKILRVFVCSNSEDKLIALPVDFQMLENVCGVWFICFDNVIGKPNDLLKLLHYGFRDVRMPFPNVFQLLVCNDNMRSSYFGRDCVINIRV